MRDDDNLPPHTGEKGSASPPAILVCAEDHSACAMLGSLFAKELGCRVLEAQTFESAIEVYHSIRIHLVVLVLSERVEGVAQLKTVLGSDRTRRASVLVLACQPDGGDPVDYLVEGADDAVSFPCTPIELVARASRRLAIEREREGQRMARKYSLAGDLTSAGLADLVTLLEQGTLSGSLELLTRRGSAELLIRDGQVTHVTFANIRGRSAFFELLRERGGQFEFVPGEWVPGDSSSAVDGPNAALLLEGSRAMDENPEELPRVVARRKESDRGPIAPALKPDGHLAEEWVNLVNDPASRGELRLLTRDQVTAWTAGPPGGQRLRLALVTDVSCGLHVLSHLAPPLTLDEIAGTLQRAPSAVGLTWATPLGQTIEVLVLDQERLRLILDNVRSAPAVLILAPSYGDFLTLNMTSRALLRRLLQEAPPLGLLGVGNRALEGQVTNYLKLGKIVINSRFLQGSLWNLEIPPRTLIEEAIKYWASLPVIPDSRAA